MSLARLENSYKTQRLILRLPQQEDLPHLQRIYRDLKALVLLHETPYTTATCQHILDYWMKCWLDDGFGYFLVAEQADPERCIGFGGVATTATPGQLNLFNFYSSACWGKGYARDASSQPQCGD